MNRTRRVHIDEKLSGYFDSLVQKRCTFEIGLLVGHTLCRTNQNDFIQTAVEIPSETGMYNAYSRLLTCVTYQKN
jgi:hypothetical protein